MRKIENGDLVVIPAHTLVKSMHPSRKQFVTKRRMTVKVDHVLSGCKMNIMMNLANPDRRYGYEAFADELERYDSLMLDAQTNPDPQAAREAFRTAVDMFIETSKPSVRWPGSGGYWNEVEVDKVEEVK